MNCNVYDLVGVAFAQMTYDYDVLLMFGFRLRLVSNFGHFGKYILHEVIESVVSLGG